MTPIALPPRLFDALTDEQRASGYFVRLEPVPPPPSDRPVRWLNRAARRAEARRVR